MRLRTLRLVAFLAACLSSGCGGSSNAPTSPTPGVVTPTSPSIQGTLRWPIDCVRDVTCGPLGYPDVDNDGKAYNCGQPGYAGHQGTDIGISASQMAAGMDVFAAADGVVLWVFDGKYDKCPNANEPDCVTPLGTLPPGSTTGTVVCTRVGDYCGTGSCCCYWCFAGGNVIVIRHTDIPGVFATRYDHLRRNSVIVTEGQSVRKGQRIAQAASAGSSTGPHLHFEVWGSGFYRPVDPWAGPCGPNNSSLWEFGA